MEQIEAYWNEALRLIKPELSQIIYETWIRPLVPYKADGDDFIIEIKEEYQRSFVERYTSLIRNAIKIASKKEYNIVICNPEEINMLENPEKQREAFKIAAENMRQQNESDVNGNLNPRYVFNSFVVGNSNRMAHAASLAVAEAPAKAYNPLFLYGGVGLGKTHLMHSIAHHILEHNPNARVLYASSEKFTNELINSIKTNKNEEFRQKYRSIDVLLIDDIQFISQKEGTQEEFFHTFNTLYESNKQIIISSDRPPKEIKTLEDRLRSRFEWGLIADIQPPDYETRIAILQKKADNDNTTVPDEVLAYIAKCIVSNIRELEGALTRTMAYSTLTNVDITIELAENALKDIFNERNAVVITPERIQDIVSAHYNISPDEIKGTKRPKNIAYPRQIAMYLSRKLLDISLPKIGESFGGRDHSTVIHACTKIEKELEKNSQLQTTIIELEKKIKGQ